MDRSSPDPSGSFDDDDDEGPADMYPSQMQLRHRSVAVPQRQQQTSLASPVSDRRHDDTTASVTVVPSHGGYSEDLSPDLGLGAEADGLNGSEPRAAQNTSVGSWGVHDDSKSATSSLTTDTANSSVSHPRQRSPRTSSLMDQHQQQQQQPQEQQPAPQWRKVLYERQPFEDNYVDPKQFLSDLRENENVTGYRYGDVVRSTFAIVQQISIVVLFVCAFEKVLQHRGWHYTLAHLDVTILIVAWIMYVRHSKRVNVPANHDEARDLMVFRSRYGGNDAATIQGSRLASPARRPSQQQAGGTGPALPTPRSSHSVGAAHAYPAHDSPQQQQRRSSSSATPPLQQHHHQTDTAAARAHRTELQTTVSFFSDFGRKVIALVSLLLLLTPVLSTLTVTYSNDTIVALSVLTMALHVLTTNYSYLNGYSGKFAPDFSCNSALFGVTLMASRIASPLESGSLIAFGAFCFSLSPIVRHWVKMRSDNAHGALTAALFVLTASLLVTVPVLFVLYVVGVLVVAFVVPWWFISLHSSVKYQISGPWDEAKPTNSAAAAEWANAGLLA